MNGRVAMFRVGLVRVVPSRFIFGDRAFGSFLAACRPSADSRFRFSAEALPQGLHHHHDRSLRLPHHPPLAGAAAETIGASSGGVTVVKAQVKTGGRGKAGGVKVAKTVDEAEAHADLADLYDSDGLPR